MIRVNEQVEVNRERMMWELLERPSMVGGCDACRKLELAQMRADRRLFGESRTVAGMAV